MGNTTRSVGYIDGQGVPRTHERSDIATRRQLDRADRQRKLTRDARRIEREERVTARLEGDLELPLGSTVRTVTA